VWIEEAASAERQRRLVDRCVAAVMAPAMMIVPKMAIANIQALGSRLLRIALAARASSAMPPMSPTWLRNERSRTVAHASEVRGSGGCHQRSIDEDADVDLRLLATLDNGCYVN
jgi:hypothetical protein